MSRMRAIRLVATVAVLSALGVTAAYAANLARDATFTRATARLEAGRLGFSLRTLSNGQARSRVEFGVRAHRNTRAMALVTPCYRAGRALRCPSRSRKRTDRYLLRRGGNIVSRLVRLAIPGRRVTCVRVDLREVRGDRFLRLIRTERGRTTDDLCVT